MKIIDILRKLAIDNLRKFKENDVQGKCLNNY